MLFVEVNNVEQYHKELDNLGLHRKYINVRLTSIKTDTWGKECFLHDPSIVL